MKMKTVKRSLGIVLSMAMTMTLFGCGSDDATKEQISHNSKITETIENTASKDAGADGGKDMTFWIFLDPNPQKILEV